MKHTETEIITAYNLKDFDSIRNTYIDLVNDRTKMDRWFDKFLDMFDEKFATMDRKDPARKLYDKKFEEYEHLSRIIKIAEHYMIKVQNV